jgi:hypothetical protein
LSKPSTRSDDQPPPPPPPFRCAGT